MAIDPYKEPVPSFDKLIDYVDAGALQLNLEFLEKTNSEKNSILINKIKNRIVELQDPEVEAVRVKKLAEFSNMLENQAIRRSYGDRYYKTFKTSTAILSMNPNNLGELNKEIFGREERYGFDNLEKLKVMLHVLSPQQANKHNIIVSKMMLLQNPGYNEIMSNPINKEFYHAIKSNNLAGFDKTLPLVRGKDLSLIFAIPQFPAIEMQQRIRDSTDIVNSKLKQKNVSTVYLRGQQEPAMPSALPEQINNGAVKQDFTVPYAPLAQINNETNLRGLPMNNDPSNAFRAISLPENQVGGWKDNAALGGVALAGAAAAYLVRKVIGRGNAKGSNKSK